MAEALSLGFMCTTILTYKPCAPGEQGLLKNSLHISILEKDIPVLIQFYIRIRLVFGFLLTPPMAWASLLLVGDLGLRV